MGTLLAGMIAAESGWRVQHLGADLPAPAIVRGMSETGAVALALSVVREMPELLGELRLIRDKLPGSVAIFVGGEGSRAHQAEIVSAGCVWLPELATLSTHLREIRTRGQKQGGR